ncbi:cysteine hydrolase family protein [Niallia sp. 01092]|uniref:cysteine hydrolase family protein n=1 Tax=unclassified Niallia TaxID=2837522 RepID=UPI003FD29FCE
MKEEFDILNKALIVIDYTVDFVADDGKLTCGKPGQVIEDNIVGLVEKFSNDQSWIVLAVDKHEENDPYHPETKLFSAHNLIGTKGRDFYGKLESWYQANKDYSKLYYMDKTRYSSFAGTGLDMWLRARRIEEIHVCGVCTDICVLHTLVDAYNLGYKIVVHADSCASFNQQGHEWALQHFKHSLGAEIIG